MKTILITGAGPNGITGRKIKEKLIYKYSVLTPSSQELDLTSYEQVENFFKNNSIDYIIHCATFRSTSTPDKTLLESNLRMFYNLASFHHLFKKMICLGSGAEFDKRKEIIDVCEFSIGKSVPIDSYGLSKYIINREIENASNIINLRLFGTINEYERFDKNIVSNLCAKISLEIVPTLRQDCLFSFIDIDDLVRFIEIVLNNNTQFKSYNLVNPEKIYLSRLIEILLEKHKCSDFVIFNSGLGNEYTGSPSRLMKEFPNFSFTSLEESIFRVLRYYKSIKNDLVYGNVKKSI